MMWAFLISISVALVSVRARAQGFPIVHYYLCRLGISIWILIIYLRSARPVGWLSISGHYISACVASLGVF
ncbi:hypothetical protein F5B17DRAFT_413553 [Nemania serpens]|nr:hypothetical protein F5B17DRAFT_413553 [Nemania serpens]